MSQDLLAEFGDFALNDNKQKAGPGWTQASSLSQSVEQFTQPQSSVFPGTSEVDEEHPWGGDDDGDGDDFGDFEAPEQDPIPANVQHEPSRPDRPLPKEEKSTSSTPATTNKARSARDLSSKHPFASNPEFLFNADDYDEFAEDGIEDGDDDDGFGDFETTEAPAPSRKPTTKQPAAPVRQQKAVVPKAQTATFDLLGLDSDDPPVTSGTPPLPSLASAPPKKSIIGTKAVPKAASTRPAPAPREESLLSNDDAWDDFETPQPSQPSPPYQSPPPAQQPEEPAPINLPTDLIGDLSTPPTNPGVAPSNIPPPSLLLTVFPPVLTALSSQFLHPLTGLSPAQKTAFLSAPATKSFLKSYIALTHILAHVIAGRKSRWKRDKHLAQSMRIGPAVSGRSGGMKLAGLDRSEAGREDTEVEAVLGVWREQVGRLKSAVVAAAGAGSSVPDLGPALPVRVAKAAEGAIASTQACALCGLKREERVAKVDSAVEDSFGEWWVEGTNMHTACLNFWGVFKGRLNSR